jgi:hypothetical protein
MSWGTGTEFSYWENDATLANVIDSFVIVLWDNDSSSGDIVGGGGIVSGGDAEGVGLFVIDLLTL